MLQVTIRLINTINDTLELRRDDESLAAESNQTDKYVLLNARTA